VFRFEGRRLPEPFGDFQLPTSEADYGSLPGWLAVPV